MSRPDPVESAVLEALRPALEAAIEHGRAAVRDGDPGSVPRPVRRLLDLTRVTPQTLRVVRAALDADDGYRSGVAASPAAEHLDGPAADWLARSPGWDARLEAVVAEARHREVLADESAARRDAQRRLARAEDRRRRAEGDLERSVADVERLRERLQDRSEAVDELRAELEEAAADRDGLSDRLAAAAERAQRAEATLGEERARWRRRAAEIERLTAELDEARAAATGEAGAGEPAPGPAVDVDELRRVVARAAELVGLIDPDRAGGEGATGSGDRSGPRRRRAIRLGRGLVEGTPEATLALLAEPGMAVLVDGYNVTKSAWPDLGLDLQRERLVAVLDDVCVRTGAGCDVVFDGADVAPGLPRPGNERVRVWFSAAGVEADDDILARVAGLPVDRPVTVVSSDRRVREGAAGHGANLVSSGELIQVFR